MDLDFWQQRWNSDETGFHQKTVNPYLSYFYDTKGPGLDQRSSLKVFVPLCGKSADLHWLSGKGYSVLGVEFSDIAVKAFFDEQNIKHTITPSATHQRYASDSIEILLGDFFTLKNDEMDDVTDVFDRASLIALPEDMRRQYVMKMTEMLKTGTRTLLITLAYDQDEMDGPPFSVTEEEVIDLYADHYKIDKLIVKDTLNDEPRFRERGLTSLKENVYKLTKL